MFKIVLLCYDYRKPFPYLDSFDSALETREEAEVIMLRCALNELNELNAPTEEGGKPERAFTAQLDDEAYDVIICCWDGEDYMPVTCYKIVEV